MIAIRKLQYDPARYFYPMPDLEHLHTVLTMSTTNALMMMNPSLAAVASATPGIMQGEAPHVVITELEESLCTSCRATWQSRRCTNFT